ncbi:MAG: hypothetical protein KGL48_05030 [Sphingomonadales bacterium]|nr:hypothetical protein [Sphingomonadales bacterium]MDE2568714.1 hypothetical protein [Sphingomonadales bacterium]
MGYSTFPDFTPIQKRMIAAALGAAKGTAKGGGPGGGGGGGGGGTGGTGNYTIPYWEAPITSPTDGNTYTMSMVGAAPPTASTVNYVPIVLRVTMGKNVYDPTTPACDDSVAIQDRFFGSATVVGSPLFRDYNFSNVNTGSSLYNDQLASINTQLADAFQRAGFWTNGGSTGYGVKLAPAYDPSTKAAVKPIVVSVSLSGQTYNMSCANGSRIKLGAVSINTFDSTVQSVIKQVYSTHGFNASTLPVVLTYNIVESQNGGCCILGYHNAVPYDDGITNGVLTYATGAYVDSGIFTGVDDIAIWSHEITEWLDDPFVQASVSGGGADSLTPAWGHVGQVSACQNNLEVGDPLSGTEFALPPDPGTGGFTYHMQDLAFYDWFYRTPMDSATGITDNARQKWYSFLGKFKAADLQGLCN